MMKVVAPFLFGLLLGCASEDFAPRTSFDDSKGLAVVTATGGDFVQLDGTRMPLDEAVLRLRLRTREMPRDDRQLHFVVQVLAPRSGDAATDRSIGDQVGRLLDELKNMGVKQVHVL